MILAPWAVSCARGGAAGLDPKDLGCPEGLGARRAEGLGVAKGLGAGPERCLVKIEVVVSGASDLVLTPSD